MSPKNGFFSSEDDGGIRSQARGAYLQLRSRIIQGNLAPLEKLKIARLASEMAINSSAVREALSRLASDRLVEARDQQGFRVAAISLDELEDLTTTRIDIETIALTKSIALGDHLWEARVRAAHTAISAHAGNPRTPEGWALHKDFHNALLAACGNRSLLQVRNSLYELTERYRNIGIRYAIQPRPVVDEHNRIAKAVLARETDRAVAELTSHLRKTAELVRDAITELSAGTVSA